MVREAAPRARGQGLVEFALVLPVVLLILIAAVDVARLFFAYVTITNAAKEGALFGAISPACAHATDCQNPNNADWHTSSDLNDLSPSPSITVTCNGASMPAACSSGSTYEIAVTYPFSFFTPLAGSIFGSPMNLRATASSLVLNDAAAVNYPALGIEKTSTTTSVTAPGQVIPYTFHIYNTGNVPVTGIVVTDSLIGTISGCPSTLAVDAIGTCSGSYTVQAGDMNGVNLSNLVSVTSNEAAVATAVLPIPIQPSEACQAPVVSFSASPTSGAGSQVTVTFTGVSSGNPVYWYWDFGDGSAPQQSPQGQTSPYVVKHVYERGSQHGTLHFNPTLTVKTGASATCATTASAPSNNYITLSP